MQNKLLKGGRLTSWLYTQCGQGVEFGSIPRTNPDRGRVDHLNQGPPDFESSSLSHLASPPPKVSFWLAETRHTYT